MTITEKKNCDVKSRINSCAPFEGYARAARLLLVIFVTASSGHSYAEDPVFSPHCDYLFDVSRKGVVLNEQFSFFESMFMNVSLYFPKQEGGQTKKMLDLLDAKEELYYTEDLKRGELRHVGFSYFRHPRTYGALIDRSKLDRELVDKYLEAMRETLGSKLRGEESALTLVPTDVEGVIPLKIKLTATNGMGLSRVFLDVEQDTFGYHEIHETSFRRRIARVMMRPHMFWQMRLETTRDSPNFDGIPVCVGIDPDPGWTHSTE